MTQKVIPAKTLIIFDIEYSDWQLCKRHGVPVEIIEIGAIKVNRNLDEIGSYSSYIKPSDMNYVTAEVQRVTGIEPTSLRKARDLRKVMDEFSEWAGYSTLAGWGPQDYTLIESSYDQWPFKHPYVDLMSYLMGITSDWAVPPKRYSVKILGELCGLGVQSHRALEDARYEAEILRRFLDGTN